MGLKAQLDNFRKNTLNLQTWHIPWLSRNTGGVLILTSAFFLISVIGTIATYTTHTIKEQELRSAKNDLEKVKNLFFLEEQYQSAYDNKSSSQLSVQYEKFNQPTSFSAMKSYLKKWQTNLQIKTLNVKIGPAKPHIRGKGIKTASLHLTAHVLNDKMLYQLIEKLQSDAPGLVVIRHIEMKRTNTSTSPTTIDQLLLNKTPAIVEGIIKCEWFFLDVNAQ